MIQGKTPEITIKFSSVPALPTEGKKVTVDILSENRIQVKAELNRKTLKKQVAKMEEYENWVGAMSGKIKSISPEGMVELESASVQVFEKKSTGTEAKSEGGSQAQEAKSSSAANSDKIKSQEAASQTLEPKQVEKESKLEKLIATATSPRDKTFYQELLQKAMQRGLARQSVGGVPPLKGTVEGGGFPHERLHQEAIAERKTAQVESSKSVNSSEVAKSEKADSEKPNSAEKKDKTESSAEKKPNEKPIFQAVGIIEGEVELIGKKLKVSIGAESYSLKSVGGYKTRQWSKLRQEIEEKGSSLKTMMVYPQSNLNKTGEVKISFALSSVRKGGASNSGLNMRAGEFRLAGLWQYPPKWNSPCITIRRNWEQGFVSYLEKMDEKQKASILRPNHLPVDWSDSPTEAFRVSEELLAEGKKADFVSVKARFEPEENKFKVVEVLAKPSQKIPRYLKAPKPSTSGVND